MIEIIDQWFGGQWLIIIDKDNSDDDYMALYEQLYAQMMGWA